MTVELVPIFFAKDAHASAEWYARLGFELEGKHQFAPGMPYYLFLRLGSSHLHLSEHRGDAKKNSLAYLYVDDIDEVAKEFGVAVIDQPWAREVHLTDPAKNRLRVGQRR
jgi:predicted enzyme related to lactoylglutathione lyase